MKFPYAIRDFDKLITDDYLYLDRTDRIRVIEETASELLFLRPRRFGKSLWLSTLMNYYDVAKTDDFGRLFGALAIGQNPTPLHNQYLVMRWDFSEIESYGSIRDIRDSLFAHINQWIDNFIKYYQHLVPTLANEVRISENALGSFHSVVAAAGRSPYKFYLFVDEYDNFANEVMMGSASDNQKRYHDLMSGEGLLKTLFKNVKSAGSGEGLDRLFLTGVSPIVLNDATSGANVAKDVSWHPHLHDLCGFVEEEVRQLVTQVVNDVGFPSSKGEEALEQMRIFYNGSRFVTRYPGKTLEDIPKVYNPILTFYFLEELQTFGVYPENMLDQNLAPDYNKLVYISSHAAGKQLVLDAVHDEKMVSVPTLSERFGMKEMLEKEKQRDRLATLLTYLGALTVNGVTSRGKVTLEIPNLVMRRLYAERILELSFPKPAAQDEGQQVAERLYAYGEMQQVCEFIEQHYLAIYDNRDTRSFNELTIKTLFLALLQHSQVYIMDSEPALLRRYADLIMLVRPDMRHFSVFDLLIEFKHVKQNEARQGKKKLSGEDLRQMKQRDLLALPSVQEKVDEAKAQLSAYEQTLYKKYGDVLKLRSYIVIGIGLERIVWQEVSLPLRTYPKSGCESD